MQVRSALAALAVCAAASFDRPATAAPVADFEDLALAPGSYWDGTDTIGAKTFVSHGVAFRNVSYDWGNFVSWDGFAYSNINDTATAGYTNQYAVWTPGTGLDGAGNYAIGYRGSESVRLTLADPAVVQRLRVNNTTYAALAVRDGEYVAKKFGGDDGNDPDWFKLTIRGVSEGGDPTGSVDFYLADYRFADNAQDYIVAAWATVDVSSLGTVKHLEFDLDSTDQGAFGMNTPAYFALDGVEVVPEPGALPLLAIGLGLALRARRRRA